MRIGLSQRGGSLLELLSAVLLGSLVLGMVASVGLSGQKLVTQQAKQLLLVQNLASTGLQIKRDLLQAGYNDDDASATYLSGETRVVALAQSPSRLGYVYRIAPSGNRAFRSVVFQHQLASEPDLGHGLLLCEKERPEPPTFAQAAQSGWHGNCFNLFNPKQISVTEFTLHRQSSLVGGVERHVVTITLSAELVADLRVIHQLHLTVAMRNG
ncbi:pilus assembly protein PilW [Vibrio sp. JPW-9-11-11]|uniref:pilus assembly protein PilW n=1 Tax=Vibrio sp. JPW-9-11-11 TaxID=1416532 RepID=UPI001592C3EC|nr:pilus assembly protein PilW [Vibrio sp. JPW-9-11-11]NVD06042.1 pilus assembly protein PilW [Vibrio sp. JPW-9-11-11]